MVNYRPDLDGVFSALADPTRRAILARLARGEATVSELAAPFDMSLPAISKHLRILEDVRLLGRTKSGRVHRCRMEAASLRPAAEWIARYRAFWESRLDALTDYLSETATEKPPWTKPKPPSRRKTRSSSAAASRPRAKKSSARGPIPKR